MEFLKEVARYLHRGGILSHRRCEGRRRKRPELSPISNALLPIPNVTFALYPRLPEDTASDSPSTSTEGQSTGGMSTSSPSSPLGLFTVLGQQPKAFQRSHSSRKNGKWGNKSHPREQGGLPLRDGRRERWHLGGLSQTLLTKPPPNRVCNERSSSKASQ